MARQQSTAAKFTKAGSGTLSNSDRTISLSGAENTNIVIGHDGDSKTYGSQYFEYKIGQLPSGDSSYSNVSSLINFDGTNGSTSFVDAKSLPWTANGAAALSSTQKKFGATSGYFNGSSGITTPNTPSLEFGNGSFTVEGWFYPTALPNRYQCLVSKWGTAGYSWGMYISPTGNLVATLASGVGGGSQTFVTSNATVTLNQWYHLAIVRNATDNTVTTFINGTKDTSQTYSSTLNTVSTAGWIGRDYDNYDYSFQGYIDDVRITKGVARYANSFTVPSSAYPNGTAVDFTYNSIDTLLHFDGTNGSTTITDSAIIPKTYTVTGGAQLDTSDRKFGTASLKLDNTGYLAVDHPALSHKTGDFTVEAWIKIDRSGRHTIVSKYSAYGWSFYLGASTQLVFLIRNSSSVDSFVSGVTSLTTGVWHHVAGVCSGNTITAYLNGVAEGSSTIVGTRLDFPIQTYIGRDSTTGDRNFEGHIDEFCLTIGRAKYLSNFTPPTGPISNSDNTRTSSLMHFDDADNTTVFNDDTGVKWSLSTGPIISTTQKKFGTSSLKLNGITGYISNSTPATDISRGDFTVEGWFYLNSIPNSLDAGIWMYGDMGANNYRYMFGPSNIQGNKLQFYTQGDNAGIGVGTNILSINAINTGQWYHFACVRSGNARYLFLDGVLQGTQSPVVDNLPDQTFYVGAWRSGGSTRAIDGYIDDFRITRSALYTSNFTPPSVPYSLPVGGFSKLGIGIAPAAASMADGANPDTEKAILYYSDGTKSQIDPAYSSDYLWSSVKFLMDPHALPVGNGPLLTDRKGWPWVFSGAGTAISNVQTLFGRNTLALNVSSVGPDYISTQSIAPAAVSTSPVSIEGWFYPTTVNLSGVHTIFSSSGLTGQPGGGTRLCIVNGNLTMYNGGGSSQITLLTYTTPIVPNQWYHVEVTKSRRRWMMFINGTLVHTNSTVSEVSIATTNGTLVFGRGTQLSGDTIEAFRGYLAQWRHSTVSRNYRNYPVPVKPYWYDTAENPYTTYLKFDGANGSNAVIDEVSSTLWQAGPITSTATKQRGAGSGRFTTATAATFTTQSLSRMWDWSSNLKFSIDFWIRPDSVTSGVQQNLFGYTDTSANGMWLRIPANSNQLNLQIRNSSNVVTVNGTGGALTANDWHHIAFVRDGNNFYLFQNGTIVYSTTAVSTWTYAASQGLYIGRRINNFAAEQFVGYIDEVRVSCGFARWTSNFNINTLYTQTLNTPYTISGRTTFGTGFAAGDIIGIETVMDNNNSFKVYAYKNGILQGLLAHMEDVDFNLYGAGTKPYLFVEGSNTDPLQLQLQPIHLFIPDSSDMWSKDAHWSTYTLSEDHPNYQPDNGSGRYLQLPYNKIGFWPVSTSQSSSASFGGTLGRTTGMYYFEQTITSIAQTTNPMMIGIQSAYTAALSSVTTDWVHYRGDGIVRVGPSQITGLPTYAVGDIIGVRVDLDLQRIWFYKNNVAINSGNYYDYTGLWVAGTPMVPAIRCSLFNGTINAPCVLKTIIKNPDAPPASEADPFTSSVSSYLRFTGTNGGTAIIDEKGNTWQAMNGAQLSTTQFKSSPSSLSVAGGAYIKSGAVPNLDMESGDFTIEGWIYINAYTQPYGTLVTTAMTTWAPGNMIFRFQNTGQLVCYVYNQVPALVESPTVLQTGRWHHVALSKNSNVTRLFFNGSLEATGLSTTAVNLNSNNGTLLGNSLLHPTTDAFNGYMDDWRFTKGIGRYTTNFVPGDPNVLSYLPLNGANGSTTFTDNAGLSWTAAGGVTISTAQSYAGGASMRLTAGGYIHNAYLAGRFNPVNNFTAEAYVYITTTAKRHAFYHAMDTASTNNGYYAAIMPGGYVRIMLGTNQSGTVMDTPSSGAPLIPVNTWTHLAIVRDGQNVRVFIGGQIAGSFQINGTASQQNNSRMVLGYEPTNAANNFEGYMDNWTYTDNTAKYTTNFTPGGGITVGKLYELTYDPPSGSLPWSSYIEESILPVGDGIKGRITQVWKNVIVGDQNSNTEVSQVYSEALYKRIRENWAYQTQIWREVLAGSNGYSNTEVTQVYAEVLVKDPPPDRALQTQMWRDAIVSGQGDTEVSQVYAETLIKQEPVSTNRNRVTQLWNEAVVGSTGETDTEVSQVYAEALIKNVIRVRYPIVTMTNSRDD